MAAPSGEKAPLLQEQEAPSLATGYGDPQGPPPQAPPPQAPPPQYSGEPRAPPPPQGGPYGGYQSTPGGYQGAQNTNTTVVVQNAAAAPNPVLGENPAIITCPNCRVQNRTNISFTSGLLTFLLVGVLFIFGFWLVCRVPYCMCMSDKFKSDGDH